MFNPQSDGGVAVLNAQALRIWNEFKSPHPVATLSPIAGHDAAPIARQMAELGLLQPVEAKPTLYQARPQTLSAWLHVTNECNLFCDYCYVHKTAESMTPEVGFAAIDAIIRSATSGSFKNVKLKFSGGEATLNLKLVLAL
ncbi:MAG: radical SAM/SPASM domain-containing protein, partial [Chloroflexi bacterium]|nr:radical SAM/SPASM domain-containing protein [Chloroflexota bacterium]